MFQSDYINMNYEKSIICLGNNKFIFIINE